MVPRIGGFRVRFQGNLGRGRGFLIPQCLKNWKRIKTQKKGKSNSKAGLLATHIRKYIFEILVFVFICFCFCFCFLLYIN